MLGLSATPLMTVAAAIAVANGACLIWQVTVSARRGLQRPRVVMVVQHATAALAVFLLFVSFSLT